MKTIKAIVLLLAVALGLAPVRADEGMWVVGHIPAKTDSLLHELGLELTSEELYSDEHPSLNNAIVMFGGFCSGVVVSPDGLVFTNHHCGFGSIQEHSSVKHDYLKDGFVAKTLADELQNDGLFVMFHLKTIDVTDLILTAASQYKDRWMRDRAIDSLANRLTTMVDYSAKGIQSEVNPFYKGSKYYLTVYQRFDDVRLVFAPPQCLGKYGGDTDNWMWPRQTCDFSVFRIYADRNNQPAEYSKDNVPYHPVSYAHVSTQGYKPGSYAMTLGYPGSTDRYLSSYGIESLMRNTNDVRHDTRTVKLDVLREAMNQSDALRIMYASKYASSSNYWKFSLGQNTALRNLNVIDEKRQLERELMEWAAQDTVARGKYIGLADSLREAYVAKVAMCNHPGHKAEGVPHDDALHDYNLWIESIYQGSDIFRFAFSTRGWSEGRDFAKAVEKAYKDIDIETDKRMFKTMVRYFHENVRSKDYYDSENDQAVAHVTNSDSLIEAIYAKSIFTRPDELAKVKNVEELLEDPMFEYMMEQIEIMQILHPFAFHVQRIDEMERLLGDGIREMNHSKDYYPDANFTLRLSYGLCEPINFAPGTTGLKEEATALTTTPQSFINKHEQSRGDDADPNVRMDYNLIPPVLKWMKAGKFSKQYLDKETGKLPLCFLTTNDITGGNSGSGMFDGRGRLIGLAFDGNWEAMSGDIKFDPNLQRCIGVDIRWVLSVIDDYSHATRLIKELTIE